MTLKGYDEEFRLYSLGFPNREVEEGFVKYLVPFYSPCKVEKPQMFIANFVKDVRMGNAESFMHRVERFFDGGDYQVAGKAELYFRNTLWALFKLLGLYVDVERHTTDGRMDILVQTKDFVYILELKIDQSADIALQQIEEKQYAKPFEGDGRTIFKNRCQLLLGNPPHDGVENGVLICPNFTSKSRKKKKNRFSFCI